jgi:hypothetical protein
MNNLILSRIAVLIFSICILILNGCFSSTSIYKKIYTNNDSLFVQRDVGAEVFIVVNNGEEYTSELLTVRDSTIIVSNEYGLTEEELLQSAYQINIIGIHNIKSIWILGEDNLLIGLAIGVGIGYALLRISASQEGEYKYYIAGLGLLSAVTGLLVGASTSRYDEEIYNYKNPEDFDFTQLNIYSRYGGKEPEYLKEIK